MAETDPVEVVVEIIDSYSEELTELQGMLEEIDSQNVDVDFKFDGEEGEVAKLQAMLEELDLQSVDTEVLFRTVGFAKAMAEKQALSRDTVSTLSFDSDGGGMAHLRDMPLSEGFLSPDTPAVGQRGMAHLGQNIDASSLAQRLSPGQVGYSSTSQSNLRGMAEALGEMDDAVDMGSFRRMKRLQRTLSGHTSAMTESARAASRAVGGQRQIRRAVSEATSRFQHMNSIVNRLRPNIMQVWNALAALIPVLVTSAGAAIGLAGALIAVGTAAAAVIGVGLLGWGKDLESSMENVQQRFGEVADEIFMGLQPAARELQPIFEKWLRGLPRQIERLNQPLRRMTELTDTAEMAGGGLISWIGDVLNAMADVDDAIHVIVRDFGSAFGGFLIEAMTELVVWTAENRNMLLEMFSAMADLLSIVFDLSFAVSTLVVRLAPLIAGIETITDVLSNELIGAFLTGISIIWAMHGAVAALSAIKGFLATKSMPSVINGIRSYVGAVASAEAITLSWAGALATLRKALATTGVGLGVIGLGLAAEELLMPDIGSSVPASAGSRGRGAPSTVINVQGDVRDREMNKIIDKMQGEAQSEIDAQRQIGEL